ncbi:MAG: zinc-binding dehydrogenase [Chloroflexi bacterium]|nr:zinc-binding dehydrogenase [Chloroflexota bacterium]
MLLLGAAGPMGQIHFQRALQAEASPRLVVATSRSMDRLGLLVPKYRDLIAAKEGQTRVLVRAFGERLTEAFCKELLAETGGQGFDDIIVLAPSAQVVADAMPLLAPQGVMNIFAGLPRGTKAAIDLYPIARHGVRLIGSSGSSIADLRHMLEEAESGRLDPNLSVVAISGLGDAKKGLEGVMSQRFPGKVVIYPQVLDFPLTMLPDLKGRLPRVYERLGPNESWTVEAEAAFLEELLP